MTGGGSATDAGPHDALHIEALVGAPVHVERAVVDAAQEGGRELPPGSSDHAAIASEALALIRPR